MKKSKLILIALIMLMITIFLTTNNLMEVSASSVDLTAKSYIVIDTNGKVLKEHNSEEKREVASICKLMTTLITLEELDKNNISLDDKFVASEYACAVEGSQAFLDAGQEYTVRDLLKSVIVASANDSAIVLSENIAGSESNFVQRMNEKAKELGMLNTKYSNSTGLTGEEHYSTAKDTAIILNEVSDYDIYKEYCQIWMDELIHSSGRKTELVNTNRLIKYYPYCQTGKTGFTDEAGYCLSSTAYNNNMKLTCVVLGCKSSADRFTESVALYNDAYANFTSEKIIDKDKLVPNDILINKGNKENIEIKPKNDYYLTLNKQQKDVYNLEYKFIDKISAPVQIGDKVGEINIIVDGNIIDKVDLISNTQIDKQTYKDIVNKFIDKFSMFS